MGGADQIEPAFSRTSLTTICGFTAAAPLEGELHGIARFVLRSPAPRDSVRRSRNPRPGAELATAITRRGPAVRHSKCDT